MSFQFYYTSWKVIKDDLFTLFNAFYHHNLDVCKFNLASICLIPKREDAITVRDFYIVNQYIII